MGRSPADLCSPAGMMCAGRPRARSDVLNAIFYVLRTGMPWRDLPERYAPDTTAYSRFNRDPPAPS